MRCCPTLRPAAAPALPLRRVIWPTGAKYSRTHDLRVGWIDPSSLMALAEQVPGSCVSRVHAPTVGRGVRPRSPRARACQRRRRPSPRIRGQRRPRRVPTVAARPCLPTATSPKPTYTQASVGRGVRPRSPRIARARLTKPTTTARPSNARKCAYPAHRLDATMRLPAGQRVRVEPRSSDVRQAPGPARGRRAPVSRRAHSAPAPAPRPARPSLTVRRQRRCDRHRLLAR